MDITSPFLLISLPVFSGGKRTTGRSIGALSANVHLGELGARGNDLLDPELTELGLQLTELLGELVLVLPPQLTSLDLA